jgi:hypothetical protein
MVLLSSVGWSPARIATLLGYCDPTVRSTLKDFLEVCDLAPTLLTAHSWGLPGQSKRIDYESPQGPRVNAMAAYRPYGNSPRL